MKDKTKNIMLLITQILISGLSFLPFIFTLDAFTGKFDNHQLDRKWNIINLFGLNHNGNLEPSFSLPSSVLYFIFYIILLLIFILILLNFKKRLLFPLILGFSICGFILFSIICYITTSNETIHYYYISSNHEKTKYILKDKYYMETGAYLLFVLFIALIIIALISSIPQLKKSIAKSREDKLNRQKAFENMAHYTPTEQPMHFANNEYFFCTKCGYKNTADSRFCKSCGQKIE